MKGKILFSKQTRLILSLVCLSILSSCTIEEFETGLVENVAKPFAESFIVGMIIMFCLSTIFVIIMKILFRYNKELAEAVMIGVSVFFFLWYINDDITKLQGNAITLPLMLIASAITAIVFWYVQKDKTQK